MPASLTWGTVVSQTLGIIDVKDEAMSKSPTSGVSGWQDPWSIWWLLSNTWPNCWEWSLCSEWRIYRVWRIYDPTIEPCVACVLHLACLERAIARTSRFTCLPHSHLRLDRRDTSHAGSAHKRILPIGRTRGVHTTVAAVLYLYIL